MTIEFFQRLVGGWLALLVVGVLAIHAWTRIEPGAMPSPDAGDWALAALEAARVGLPVPEPPADARAFEADGGIIFVLAWRRGMLYAQHVGHGTLADAVTGAIAQFAADERLTGLPDWRADTDAEVKVRFSLAVSHGEGPLVLGIPYLENLSLVPVHEGLVARLGDEAAYIVPDELLSRDQYEHGVPLPIPDTSMGSDVQGLASRLARDLGVDLPELLSRGSVRRFRAGRIAEAQWPREASVDEASLRAAAVDGAEFLLMHMEPDGRYTYIYDPVRGRGRGGAYNLPRHSGATYFLAQVHHLHGMPEAREGAIKALRWVERNRVRRCGGEDLWCVAQGNHADVGSAALTALAASEVLETGDDPTARGLAEGLTSFLRSLQREDGELMHEYDLSADAPRDIQHMYYSGEAALALLHVHRTLGDDRNLEAAQRVMQHLTGVGWDFFGSQYYYGEEHWTCNSGAEAGDRIGPEALDFCMRWATFNRRIQMIDDQTPWPSRGAYGVGPGLIVPRLTPVGSRSEAFVSTYQMARAAGIDASLPRALVEDGLSQLMRWRFDPGPSHLFTNPLQARGGIPGSPVDLSVRNDFVQHGGSAIIRWADVLRREREHGAD